MNAERQNVVAVFTEALQVTDPAKRKTYLDRVCAGNQPLRQEVETLLRAHEQAGDFLCRTRPLPPSDFVIERTGMMIGRYKLLEQIGEGGFGVV
jgi:hypothetical protein